MAKKQMTPEEYKAMLEIKAAKSERFSKVFLSSIAVLLAVVITFSMVSIAYTTMGMVGKTGAVSGTVNNGGTSNNGGSVSTDDSLLGDNTTTPGDTTVPGDDTTTPGGDVATPDGNGTAAPAPGKDRPRWYGRGSGRRPHGGS
jgi:cell division protein FtsL